MSVERLAAVVARSSAVRDFTCQIEDLRVFMFVVLYLRVSRYRRFEGVVDTQCGHRRVTSWCWWGFLKNANHAVRLGLERRKRGAHGPHRAEEISHPCDRPRSVVAAKTKILFRALGETELEEVMLEIRREYVCYAQFRGESHDVGN